VEHEAAIDRVVREMIEQYGRSAGIIADQHAASYRASGDFDRSRTWRKMAAAIRRLINMPG
jgi:hypothetical protein